MTYKGRDFREIDWKKVFCIADPDTHKLLKLTAEYVGASKSTIVRTILKAWLRECWGTWAEAQEITNRIDRLPEEETRLRKAVKQHFQKLTLERGTGLFR